MAGRLRRLVGAVNSEGRNSFARRRTADGASLGEHGHTIQTDHRRDGVSARASAKSGRHRDSAWVRPPAPIVKSPATRAGHARSIHQPTRGAHASSGCCRIAGATGGRRSVRVCRRTVRRRAWRRGVTAGHPQCSAARRGVAIEALRTFETRNELFVRSHLALPTGIATAWTLAIDGEVARPVTFRLDDIRRMRAEHRSADDRVRRKRPRPSRAPDDRRSADRGRRVGR